MKAYRSLSGGGGEGMGVEGGKGRREEQDIGCTG